MAAALALLMAAIRRRWLLAPVAACLLLACAPSGASAQNCPGGICYPPNYLAPGGTYVMYPQAQTQITAGDWAAGYKSMSDERGNRYLWARVTSSKYGAGIAYFQPDAWRKVVPAKPEKPAETGQTITNYGVDIDKLKDQPTGSILTNDPSFRPDGPDAASSLVIEAPPQAELARSVILPVAVVALAIALFFRFRAHRRLALQP